MNVERGSLIVAPELADFIESDVLPTTGIDDADFWRGLADLVAEFAPQARRLLQRRAELQAQLDEWHRQHAADPSGYRDFLADIGYLLPVAEPFEVDPGSLDPEISAYAAPQLVVPLSNERYTLNAVNARWGSLYDALYGTDALGSSPPSGPYDDARGAQVIVRGRELLDQWVPLEGFSHHDVVRYAVDDDGFAAASADGSLHRLKDGDQFMGIVGEPPDPGRLYLRHHGLGIELVIDRNHPVGRSDRAGVADLSLESAVTVILDGEDSVSAIDAADKTHVYRNLLGMMKRELSANFVKSGANVSRALRDDWEITSVSGGSCSVRGTALMLVRNVGMQMWTDAVTTADGAAIPEGLLDATVTVACALHDRQRTSGAKNSAVGAVYIVIPKTHGPDEAAYVDHYLSRIETMFGLPANAVKVGLMDEERRTSLNLGRCLGALRHRIAFVNTGFLDRTGDEIHTSMHAGPVVRKDEMKATPWLDAYERSNVAVAAAAGMLGRCQIGKGMWAAPDRMRDMLETKGAQLRTGASTAWVPSPTAATLHACHYHDVDVVAVQAAVPAEDLEALTNSMLTIPVEPRGAAAWSASDRQRELENNLQGILGYAVRWVDQGVGCSKVPDIDGTGLMEDRATCRISAQHVGNWLLHGIITTAEVDDAMRRMAALVDEQNAGDDAYTPMAPACDGAAFHAARRLVVEASSTANGYIEGPLHDGRRAVKCR